MFLQSGAHCQFIYVYKTVSALASFPYCLLMACILCERNAPSDRERQHCAFVVRFVVFTSPPDFLTNSPPP